MEITLAVMKEKRGWLTVPRSSLIFLLDFQTRFVTESERIHPINLSMRPIDKAWQGLSHTILTAFVLSIQVDKNKAKSN
eukprot:scaffold5178_cov141-Skeletonema_menzelii.AAC.2